MLLSRWEVGSTSSFGKTLGWETSSYERIPRIFQIASNPDSTISQWWEDNTWNMTEEKSK